MTHQLYSTKNRYVATTAIAFGCMLAMQVSSHADEKRVHAKPGSFWDYIITDELKQTKIIVENILTELKGEDRVIRANTQGRTNYGTSVYDKNWNLVEGVQFKYTPYLGSNLLDALNIGSSSYADITYNEQLQTGWSEPRPMAVETAITGMETVTTKAGQFATYRIESTVKFSFPATPLTETETKNIFWFSPKVDHWVKTQSEQRSNGRLVQRSTQELIEYKIK